jgi:pyruvate decarboxylase
MLPTNVVFEKISSSRLSTPISRSLPPNDPPTEQYVLDEIVKLIEGAGRDIVVLVDACTVRHHVRQELKELLDKTGFPVYSSPMGKTVISESYENYGGVRYQSFGLLRKSSR